MPMLADQVDAVIGVDTHHDDTHTASIVTPLGAELAHPQAPADAAGYRALLDFARFHAPGTRIVWALEGTRSHGTGPTRALQACGGRVVEVDRPKRPVRKHGKSDPIDATRAARDALTRVRLAEPRADGAREELLAGVLRAGNRHRLNRGRDRQLNRVLRGVAIHRLRYDPRTRAYADRRQAAGSTDRETRRCLIG